MTDCKKVVKNDECSCGNEKPDFQPVCALCSLRQYAKEKLNK